MSQRDQSNPRSCACPECGGRLQPEGDTFVCPHHGRFFSYGPRLLVHVATAKTARQPLLPWQTLREPAEK